VTNNRAQVADHGTPHYFILDIVIIALVPISVSVRQNHTRAPVCGPAGWYGSRRPLKARGTTWHADTGWFHRRPVGDLQQLARSSITNRRVGRWRTSPSRERSEQGRDSEMSCHRKDGGRCDRWVSHVVREFGLGQFVG
jgi:hypothetical protein